MSESRYFETFCTKSPLKPEKMDPSMWDINLQFYNLFFRYIPSELQECRRFEVWSFDIYNSAFSVRTTQTLWCPFHTFKKDFPPSNGSRNKDKAPLKQPCQNPWMTKQHLIQLNLVNGNRMGGKENPGIRKLEHTVLFPYMQSHYRLFVHAYLLT